MPIPQNITRDHILRAIDFIDTHGVPAKRKLTGNGVLSKEHLYPPKYVLAIANSYINNEELRYFSGEDECNNFLEQRGFEILSKSEERTGLFINRLVSSEHSREYNTACSVKKRGAIINE